MQDDILIPREKAHRTILNSIWVSKKFEWNSQKPHNWVPPSYIHEISKKPNCLVQCPSVFDRGTLDLQLYHFRISSVSN
jgi:hypothetical protein